MNYTKHLECGCKIVVIGELTNATIKYCPEHDAAPDLYEALKALVNRFQTAAIMAGLTEEYTKGELEQANEALSKADRRD